jgi:hypothetical protein
MCVGGAKGANLSALTKHVQAPPNQYPVLPKPWNPQQLELTAREKVRQCNACDMCGFAVS